MDRNLGYDILGLCARLGGGDLYKGADVLIDVSGLYIKDPYAGIEKLKQLIARPGLIGPFPALTMDPEKPFADLLPERTMQAVLQYLKERLNVDYEAALVKHLDRLTTEG